MPFVISKLRCSIRCISRGKCHLDFALKRARCPVRVEDISAIIDSEALARVGVFRSRLLARRLLEEQHWLSQSKTEIVAQSPGR